ncbi:MAG: PAS domain S-box protein [Deltaproteobacteria bacterium]|jgi:PAS domain S-box-containing protein|nr:PAS domain S-box protein [Deltaproteobacteria bacterium]
MKKAAAKTAPCDSTKTTETHTMQPAYATEDLHAPKTLVRSQNRFHYAFLTSPDTVAIIEARKGIYTDVNEMFSLFLGHAKEDIIGKGFKEIAVLEDAAEQKQLLGSIRKRGPVINRETRFVDAEGVVKTGLLSVMSMPLNQKEHFVLAIRNIDALRKVEEALEKSEARYRELFNNMSSGVAVFQVRKEGTEFVLIDFNRAAERIENIKKERILGRNFVEVMPSAEKYGLLETFRRVHKTGKPEYHPVAIYKDGDLVLWKENYVYRLPAGEIVDVYDDITERKQAERKLLIYQEKLQSLASELSLVEERERRSIATDLHDQIGQTLSVIKMRCFELRQELKDPHLTRQVDEIKELVKQTIQDTRSLTFELSPPVLYELGLVAAIDWLAEQFQLKHNLKCSVETDKKSAPLSQDIEIVLFRSVRELLVNIVKHAQARKVKITIRVNKSNLRIRVTDDGIGFSTEAKAARTYRDQQFGLFNITERVRHLGGSLEVDSQRSKGTMVTLVAPLKSVAKS